MRLWFLSLAFEKNACTGGVPCGSQRHAGAGRTASRRELRLGASNHRRATSLNGHLRQKENGQLCTRRASPRASKVSAANQNVARPGVDVPVLRAQCPPAVAAHQYLSRAARRAGCQQAQEQLPPGAQVPAKPHVCAGPNVNTTELPGRGGAKIQRPGEQAPDTHTRGTRHKAYWPYGRLVSVCQRSQSGRAAHCVASIRLPSTSPPRFAEARRRATTFEIYLPSPFHQACLSQCHSLPDEPCCATV